MNIVLNLSDKWKNGVQNSEFKLCGVIHDIEQNCSSLNTVASIVDWVDKLKEMKGFFSLVKHKDSTVFAAVDHIRSRPLFYGVSDQVFYLSDTAEWVRQQVKDMDMDEYAKVEFQVAGYVTGRNTLYKNVKQLQAGECLAYTGNKLEVRSYYTFEHSEPVKFKEEMLLAELHRVSKGSIQRLIQYANGRQIVIPLSGGYDSRLIAALLTEAGYTNILTFTYGVKGNKEATYSKMVAETLGLKWQFIEYTEKLWREAWKTKERERYQLEGSNWTSLAHMQDWLAVKIMKEQGIIEGDSVFAPGHSGDMVAGSHIPSFIHEKLTSKYERKELVNHLFNKHYSLTKCKNVLQDTIAFKSVIEESISSLDYYSAERFANECEKHNWQNRQAKYIVNSIRVYEFFECDWWIPLWDKDLVRFFEGLPLILRDHKWYVNFVDEVYINCSKNQDSISMGNASNSGFVGKLANSALLKKINLRNYLKSIYTFYMKLFSRSNDLLLINSAQSSLEINDLESKGYSTNGITAYFFLKEASKK